MNYAYEYWLASLWQITNETKRRISSLYGAKAIYKMPKKEWERLRLFSEKEMALMENSRSVWNAEEEWEALSDMRFIPWEDAAYPQRLRDIPNPPYALFVKGSLPSDERVSVAVVGARGCSEYGRNVSLLIGKTMAELNVQVISGMAIGIDSASHAGALRAGGDTFAVLGCGADVCYPKSAANLYDNILKGHGGILSEYIPGTQPRKNFFPQRNRIISGLADILIVVEARERSGSLITADCALEQGKDIYAVPGRYLDPLSVGCNRLIEQGAGIFVDMDSFLLNTGIVTQTKKKRNAKSPALSGEALLVFDCLELNVKHLDSIVKESGLDLLTVLDALDLLKKKALIRETFQNYFCKIL